MHSEIATEKEHQLRREFCDSFINLRKLVACVKRKAAAGQASRKKQWRGQGRVLLEVHGSLRELVPVNLECPRKG
ncbi:hypothetical protein TNCV_654361 [Trichonephila clavipes]|nr:hypothetical protein TNCV_654361 [Trichonephila clavipes]